MTGLLRVLVGVLTTVVFIGFGVSLLAADRWVFGLAVLALGVFRGVVLVRQVLSRRDHGPDEA